MAELFTHKRGEKWEYRFEIASVNGKRKFIQKSGFKTKSEAVKSGTEAMNKYFTTGTIFTPSEKSFTDYLNEWLEVVRYNLKNSTFTSYQKRVNNIIIPNIGKYQLKALNATILQEFINSLYKKKYSRNSLTNLKAILSSALDYAVEPMHYISSNPMRYVKLPSARLSMVNSRQSPHVLISKDDMDKIFERFPEGSTAHVPLMLGYKCGLRLGEAFALTWDDINLDNKTLSVNRQVQWHEKSKDDADSISYWYFTKPKYESTRTIVLEDELCELLKREKEKQSKAKDYYDNLYIHNYADELGKLNQDSIGTEMNLVCVEECGKFCQPRIMQHTSMVINKKLKIKFDFHSLRHTHCSMLLSAGAKPKYVQERLGHKNINVTLQVYQHLTEDMSNEGNDILNSMF